MMRHPSALGPMLLLIALFAGGLATEGSCAAERANPMLHVAAGKLVDGSARPLLLRCVNLSPWLIPEGYLMGQGSLAALTTSPSQIKRRLEAVVGPQESRAFWRSWTHHFADAADFRHLAAEGFNCVRLPLTARTLIESDTGGEFVLDPAAIAPVDKAVAWAATYGLYVILDLHDAPGGQNAVPSVSDVPSSDRTARLWAGNTAADNRRLTISLWHALAARYAHARSVGGYDLLNEPDLPKRVPKSDLPGLYAAITAAIRAVDGSHLLILEGDGYAHDFSLLQAPPDRNVMYEFHEYALFNRAWRTPTQQDLAPFLRLRAATDLPLWLGEFGEGTLAWQRGMVELMRANDIGWAVWPWKRIDLRNGHPVIETIRVPEAWRAVAGYLVGAWLARRPSRPDMERAMAGMLKAIRTSNCPEDEALERVLAGR
jgi:endoglucanase